jgi:hypothetical protein
MLQPYFKIKHRKGLKKYHPIKLMVKGKTVLIPQVGKD